MATKTPLKPALAVKKSGSAVILWEQEMKASAVKQAAGEKVFDGFKRINIQGGVMMIDGDAVQGNSLDVVVIGAVHLNEWYQTAYNSSKPTVPSCYAYGDNQLDDPESNMHPADTVEDKQGDDDGKCAGCWANQMGSADTGRGKACKNGRRLVVVTEDVMESADTLKDAEERSLSVPVMSVKNWAKYLKDVLAAELGRPYYGVVTTISVVPDPKSQFVIKFAFKQLIDFTQETWDAMKAKTAAVEKSIAAPYPAQSVLDANAAPGKPAGRGQPMKPVGKVAQKVAAKPSAAMGKAAKY